MCKSPNICKYMQNNYESDDIPSILSLFPCDMKTFMKNAIYTGFGFEWMFLKKCFDVTFSIQFIQPLISYMFCDLSR